MSHPADSVMAAQVFPVALGQGNVSERLGHGGSGGFTHFFVAIVAVSIAAA